MSLFEYVAVMVSMIIGLGVTRILQGIGGFLEARDRIRVYWVHSVFVGVIFLAHLHFWWLFWSSRDTQTWSFVPFLLLLCQPVLLYLLADLCFPSFAATEVVDLRHFYYRNRRWFFGVLALLMALISIRDWQFYTVSWLSAADLVKTVVLFIAIVGAVSESPRLHGFLAVSSFVAVSASIVIFGMDLK